jgi:tetratricopeptide (TPR) repeat protein
MPNIFISYRTTDKQYALWIYPWLIKRFGRESVFWDRKGIDPGLDFPDVIETALRGSKALVALITTNWLSAKDDAGRRKIDSPQDWVRREIATAFEAGILVIPVLAGEVNMPGARDLPEELAKLPRLQALRMTDMLFHDRLLEAIETVVPVPGVPAVAQPAAARNNEQRASTLLQRQIHRLQVRAVELIQDRKLDRAEEELAEGSDLLMALLDLLPGEINLDAQLGFLFKTVAQNFHAANQGAQAERYAELALSAFERVKADPEASREDLASAHNGVANIHSIRGELDEAIEAHHAALDLVPEYAIAWHDLFAVHEALAGRGNIDVDAMRHAFERMKETEASSPGLGQARVADFEARLRHWEQVAEASPHFRAGAEERLTEEILRGRDDAEIYYQRARARAVKGNNAGAIEDYTRAIEKGDRRPVVHLERGGLQLFHGDPAVAEADFSVVIEQGGEGAQAQVHYLRALSRFDQQALDGAEADFTAAIDQGLDQLDVYQRRGLVRLLKNDHPGAEADFTRSIELGGNDADTYFGRGTVRAHQGKTQEAEEDFLAAIARGRDDATVHYELGKVRLRRDDSAGAELAFSDAIARGQDDAEVYYYRGVTRGRSGPSAGLIADFQAAVARGLNHPRVYFLLGFAQVDDDPAAAEASFSEAIARGQDDHLVYYRRGQARLNLEQFAKAEADFTDAMQRGLDDADVFCHRARARLNQHKFTDSEADFGAAIERGQDDAVVYYGRGLARYHQGNLPASHDDFSAAIVRGADDAGIHQLRAHAGARIGRLDDLQRDCERAQELAPDDGSTHASWGGLFLSRGEYDEAIARYQAALKAQPGPAARFELGLAFLLAGRIEPARAAYAEGLKEASPEEIDTALRDLDTWTAHRDDTPGLPAEAASIRAQLEASRAAEKEEHLAVHASAG